MPPPSCIFYFGINCLSLAPVTLLRRASVRVDSSCGIMVEKNKQHWAASTLPRALIQLECLRMYMALGLGVVAVTCCTKSITSGACNPFCPTAFDKKKISYLCDRERGHRHGYGNNNIR